MADKEDAAHHLDLVQQRASELQREGLDFSHAFGRAHLESLLERWPTKWGDDFQVFLYGDFRPPDEDLVFPDLGVTVLAAPLENTVISSAGTVLAARITIGERTVEEIADAIRRINVLLGAWTLVAWGNSPVGWWSHLYHTGGSVQTDPDYPLLGPAVTRVLELPSPVRQKIEAAMFWIREPGRSWREHHRSHLLRRYSAYWNAFECLVDAVCLIRPRDKPSKSQKQATIDDFLEERGGRLTAGDIEECYRTIVNPGFVGKASHALEVCFGADGNHYVNECFKASPSGDRLYNIRNAINHGDVDAENPDELLRIDARLHRLFMIVWGMFGRLIPFPCPVDSELRRNQSESQPT